MDFVLGTTLKGIIPTRALQSIARSEGELVHTYCGMIGASIAAVSRWLPRTSMKNNEQRDVPRRIRRAMKREARRCNRKWKPPNIRWQKHFHHSYFNKWQKIGWKPAFIKPPKVTTDWRWQSSWNFGYNGFEWKPHCKGLVWYPGGFWTNAPDTDPEPDHPFPTTNSPFKHAICCDYPPCNAPRPAIDVPMFSIGSVRGRRSLRRYRKKLSRLGVTGIEINTAMAANVHSAPMINSMVNLSGGCRRDKSGLAEILWDTGASCTIGISKEDFVGDIEMFDQPREAVGIARGLKLMGQGTVRWDLAMNDNSETMRIEIPALYCPDASRRILCPQQLIAKLKSVNAAELVACEIKAHALEFKKGKRTIHVEYDVTNNLPISYAIPKTRSTSYSQEEINSLVTSERSQNLTTAQKELLRNHFKFGHLSMARIQQALRSGSLARNPSEKALHMAAGRCEIPKCAACQFAKARKRPLQGQKRTTKDEIKDGVLKDKKLLPGECIAVDHFQSSAKGRLFGSYGQTSEESMYKGACMFID